MVLILMYGVHGSGKSLASRLVAEDYGLNLIKADAIESTPEVTEMDSISREFHFIATSIAWLPIALHLSTKTTTIMDFGPLNTLPYIDYWAGGNKKLKAWLEDGYWALAKGKDVVHVFFLPESLEAVRQRLLKRGRHNAEEEAMIQYISFINNGLEKLSKRLEDAGEHVERVRADSMHAKLSRLIRIAGVDQ